MATVRRIGTFKDSLRRFADASVAAVLPDGVALVPILAQVDGYLFPHEAVFLYWLARSGPGGGAIVEIGSYRGRSTLCLAMGVKGRRSTRVLAVDPHVYGTEGDLRDNLAHFGMSAIVEPIVLPSLAVAGTWKGSVRLAFVDGHHEKASVEADVDAWLPFLEPGGFLVIHDSTDLSSFPGPAEVAKARLCPGPVFDGVGSLGGITWGRRVGATNPWTPRTYGASPLDTAMRLVKRWGVKSRGAERVAYVQPTSPKSVAETEVSACIYWHAKRWGVPAPGGVGWNRLKKPKVALPLAATSRGSARREGSHSMP